MNIFYLSSDPIEAATMQCDKHVVKMILETAQLLSTAHHILAGDGPYKVTHKNHPSAVWVRESRQNYDWTYKHFKALCAEYTDRYGKTHLTETKCSEWLSRAPEGIEDNGFTDPPECMPDECKSLKSVVLSYLEYYNHKADEWAAKGSPMKWRGVCYE